MQSDTDVELNGYVLPEKVSFSDGRIYWQPADLWKPIQYPRAKVTPEVFRRFLNLKTATNEEVFAFAKQYGPISTFPDIRDITIRLAEEKRVGESVGESPDTWRNLAQIAAAILEISAEHYKGRTGKAPDWAILDFAARPMLDGRRSIGLEMAFIAAEVNRWIRAGTVAPLLNIENGTFKVVIEGQKLRGGLAIQLLQHLGGNENHLVACSGCRHFYFAERAPRTGQDNYCQPCRDKGVPVARAKHRKYLGKATPQQNRKTVTRKKRGKR